MRVYPLNINELDLKKYHLVDIRKRDLFESFHIEGSQNANDFEELVSLAKGSKKPLALISFFENDPKKIALKLTEILPQKEFFYIVLNPYKKPRKRILEKYISIHKKKLGEFLTVPKVAQRKEPKLTIQKPSVISLFAGVGGVCSGFINAGFKIAFANELDAKACKTYRANFKHSLIEADITKLDPKDFAKADVIAGGFPCQAFSVAGYQKGFNDTRGTLFFDIMRFVDYSRPKVIFLENVKNIVRHDEGRTLRTILEEIKKRGYHSKWSVLNSATHANLPQNRERFFLVAFLSKAAYKTFAFPPKIQLNTTIRELLHSCMDEKYYYNKHPLFERLKEQITKDDTLYQWRRQYVRENKSKLCPTLTANMGTGGHNVPLVKVPKGIRKLTPRECANFQGFKGDFVLPTDLPNSALYKQIGNSVSVPLIEAIARQILKALRKS